MIIVCCFIKFVLISLYVNGIGHMKRPQHREYADVFRVSLPESKPPKSGARMKGKKKICKESNCYKVAQGSQVCVCAGYLEQVGTLTCWQKGESHIH